MSLDRFDATLFLNCDVVVTQPYPKTAIHRPSPLLMTIQPFHSKSLRSGIFVVTGRTGPIFRITTTNQEVAGSSPAGPTNVRPVNDLTIASDVNERLVQVLTACRVGGSFVRLLGPSRNVCQFRR
jgi:hypothetical protein